MNSRDDFKLMPFFFFFVSLFLWKLITFVYYFYCFPLRTDLSRMENTKTDLVGDETQGHTGWGGGELEQCGVWQVKERFLRRLWVNSAKGVKNRRGHRVGSLDEE